MGETSPDTTGVPEGPVRDRLQAYGPLAAVLVVLIAVVFVRLRYVEPAPPKSVRIATGSEQGAYAEFGKRYGKILARDGLTLEVLTTAGSVENMHLLTTPKGGADVAFLQGGPRRRGPRRTSSRSPACLLSRCGSSCAPTFGCNT